MAIEIHISGSDAIAVKHEMRELLGATVSHVDHDDRPSPDIKNMTATEASMFSDQTGTGTEAPPTKPKRNRSKKEAVPEKTIPDASEDTAETAAADDQDEADQADAEASEAEVQYTHDDVRAALSKYMKKFGIGPTQIDGPRVLGMMFGEGVTKVSDVPNDQKSLAKAVAGIEEMTAKNGFKRVPV